MPFGSSESSDFDSLIDYSDDISIDDSTTKQLSPGHYVEQACRPLTVFKSLAPKGYRRFPESFKLFSTLYSYWKATHEENIATSQLGRLLLAQHPDIYRTVEEPHLTHMLVRLITAKFPIRWQKKSCNIDFSPLVNQIEIIEGAKKKPFDINMDNLAKILGHQPQYRWLLFSLFKHDRISSPLFYFSKMMISLNPLRLPRSDFFFSTFSWFFLCRV